MTFFTFMNFVSTLYLSVGFVTTVRFDGPIDKIIGGPHKTELQRVVSRDETTIAFKPRTKNIKSNLVVFLKDNRVYRFNLEHNSKQPHDFVQVKDGEMDTKHHEVKDTRLFSIWEGNYTIRVFNKNKGRLLVNGQIIKSKEHRVFPKGSPVIINGKRELY